MRKAPKKGRVMISIKCAFQIPSANKIAPMNKQLRHTPIHVKSTKNARMSTTICFQ